VTYRVYITKDYKPIIRDTRRPGLFANRIVNRALVLVLCLTTGLIVGMRSHDAERKVIRQIEYTPPAYTLPEASEESMQSIEPVMQSLEPADEEIYVSPFPVEEETPDPVPVLSSQDMIESVIPDNWESLKVSTGDNLSIIFDRMQLSPKVLHEIMSLGKEVDILKRLMPDHEIRFQVEDGELAALEYEVNLTDTLHVSREGDAYTAETVKTELETRSKTVAGTINDSLFLSAQRAGISDNLIMQMVELYGWDIDFALDIRKGDRFYIVYEEKYKDGVKVQDGPILSAEFVNRGKPFRAVRYTHADGHTDYYNENGASMRKAFLRTPVKFSRISSGFSLGRKHPILNKIRAHRGVDYAAPTGTPIKATGDGVVDFAGNNGGYGRVVILRHGDKYSTLYGHMSRFANGMRAGKRVKQGQIIGYVGMSGLATGPHLHYEFRINNIHRNPLTVDLPKVVSIPENEMAAFRAGTRTYLAQLDAVIRASADEEKKPVVALADKNDDKSHSE